MDNPHYVFTTECSSVFNAMIREAIVGGLYFDASYNPDNEMYTISYTGAF